MPTALVTGASAGIGRSFAHELARRGHALVLVARDRAALEALADQLQREFAVAAEVLVADLAADADVARVAARLADPAAPVDLLVNNAGFGLGKGVLDSDVEDEVRLLDVLCRTVLVLSQAAAKAMVARGHGGIVNVSSVAGFSAMNTYAAAKAWATVFSEALSVELAGKGVSVTALCPGFTRTEFHQRASVPANLPGIVWLDADDVVRECLDDLARGRVVCIPSKRYRALVGLMRVVPRRMVRSVSAAVAARRVA